MPHVGRAHVFVITVIRVGCRNNRPVAIQINQSTIVTKGLNRCECVWSCAFFEWCCARDRLHWIHRFSFYPFVVTHVYDKRWWTAVGHRTRHDTYSNSIWRSNKQNWWTVFFSMISLITSILSDWIHWILNMKIESIFPSAWTEWEIVNIRGTEETRKWKVNFVENNKHLNLKKNKTKM